MAIINMIVHCHITVMFMAKEEYCIIFSFWKTHKSSMMVATAFYNIYIYQYVHADRLKVKCFLEGSDQWDKLRCCSMHSGDITGFVLIANDNLSSNIDMNWLVGKVSILHLSVPK